MNKNYGWREGARFTSIDANKAGSELGRIYKKYGILQPETVVDESRKEEAPLHPAFEWDDSKAAEGMQMELFQKYSDEETAYRFLLRQRLDEKVRRAILLLKDYEGEALKLSDDGFYVAFSGGKDSVVMAELVRMAGVKHTLNYNVTTIDPPELLRFIKGHYPQAKWNHKGECLPFHMKHKSNGPPTRLSRWCCEVYKESGGDGMAKCIGVRAEESRRRKGLWSEFRANKRAAGFYLCPIIYWTEKDIWEFILQNSLPYCELYDQGYKRLGCIGCPMSGPKNQKRDFERWPKYEQLWKLGFKMYWEKYYGTKTTKGNDRWINKMRTWEDLWKWWISGKAYKEEAPDCQLYLW